MSANETYIDTEQVVTRAARLARTAEEMRTGVSQVIAEIRRRHAARPWGTDEAGTAFEQNYLGSGDPDDAGAVEGLLAGCDSLCDYLYQLAENAGVGAIYTELVDEDQRAQLERTMAAYQRQIAEFEEAGAGGAGSGVADLAATE